MCVQGFVSYPRTETTRYPKDFDFRSILNSLKHSEYGEIASGILSSGIKNPRYEGRACLGREYGEIASGILSPGIKNPLYEGRGFGKGMWGDSLWDVELWHQEPQV